MRARAGYCQECGEDLWLREGGGCVRGHDPHSVLSAREILLPPELDRFNWGAFFFPIPWALVKGHQDGPVLCLVLPYRRRSLIEWRLTSGGR